MQPQIFDFPACVSDSEKHKLPALVRSRKTPMQAMKHWHPIHPHLFNNRPGYRSVFEMKEISAHSTYRRTIFN